MNLKDAGVLITGGSNGYGRGMAKVLKEAGANVWITGREEARLRKAEEDLGVRGVVADVSSPEDWDRVMQSTGNIDILINNAGSGGRIGPLWEQSDEEIIRTIQTNLTGAVLGCRRAGKIMAERGSGIIINISSVCALYAWPGWSVYTAAKAGLSKFSHGLYTELRPFGVRVTCVTPSWGRTGFNQAARITGASENPELAEKCIGPEELGNLVRSIIEQPDHLAVPDITIQPVIQEISPM